MINQQISQSLKSASAIGRRAEQAAALWLQKQGYTIFHTNWRTRWCEIDIIAGKDKIIYIVEVKYRRTNLAGAGLDYINSKKLSRMRRAAAIWASRNNWHGCMQLAGVEVSGPDFNITAFVPNIE